MRALPLAALVLLAGAAASAAACDSSVRVGELRHDMPEAGAVLPDTPALPPGGSEPTWRLHAPLVPCTIYAMAEARADDLYLGCNGGRLYRFDGVRARLTLEIDDEKIFSLLWVGPDGEVWAGAQSSYRDEATTQLYRFDGERWQEIGDSSKRVTSLTGVGGSVWITSGAEIFRYQNGTLKRSFTADVGEPRACAFATPDSGFCVGTQGLAVAWDGTAWSPVSSRPWSAEAEVFGVELDPFDPRATFFYGEPISHPNGSHACRIARSAGGAFTSYEASIPCFARFGVPRKRTGQVIVGGKTYMLLAPNPQYGGAFVYDLAGDEVRPLCGPVLAFSTGSAKTRVGGLFGLLATLVGSGGNQVALASLTGTSFDFDDLSVAPDGTAWARVEDTAACGSVTDRLVRFEEGAWRPVAGPQAAQSGRGLAAVSAERAYTFDLFRDLLLEHRSGTWTDGPEIEAPWTLFARRPDDVWIGGHRDNFGHFDGKVFEAKKRGDRQRQVEQIVSADGDVWRVVRGVTSGDTDVRVVRWADGEETEWNLGIEMLGASVRIAALDRTHVWRSGSPAARWDGTRWKRLPFHANNVWARSADEVYFTDRGDIWRYDGKRRERVYHGFVPITAIDGSDTRAFAVGPGGLTLELAQWEPDGAR
jgi:hypothetical protein